MRLDYMVLADYVRQDSGVVHIMGAGIDTIQAPLVPAVQPLGVAMRFSFDAADEVGRQHGVSLSFVGPDQPVLTTNSRFVTPPPAPGVPEHWRRALGVALQIAVPLPAYGDYSCELAVDGGNELRQSIDFRVIRPLGQGGSALG
jgi:hypothetical protein